MESIKKTKQELLSEIEELNRQLEEANETIEAIRTGQVDALVVQGHSGHQLYTLKSADQTYRVFIEKMTEGAVTLNLEGIIVYCNSKFASMVNLPLSKVLGLPFQDFVAAESQKEYAELFKNCWKMDCRGELILQGEETRTPVQLSLTTLELDEGVSLSIILTDLTLQKETQKQLSAYNLQLEETNHALESSNHDLQQFASVASHDLQEPLRKIQIFSNLLTEKYGRAFNEESSRYLEKIVDSAGRMKMLIIDILNYSSLSSTKSEISCLDLNILVNDVLMDFDLIIQEKQAKVVVKNLPSIAVNKGQIRQVFQNIISNALKFTRTDSSPVIEISAKRISEKSLTSPEQEDGPFCMISIHDNGIGFNEQYTLNIFALFERLHPKDKYEGTGIGLAIAKKIVEKHNGLIHVKSKEGTGSEFIIILPVTQEPC
jgi:PAS domain S-box-containing protein